MNIIFKKVIIHNFLSYGHAEIDLRDKQYCLVSGVNNCPLDNASSNGSGKSTFSSAICWALTGETINGLKSNIKNINVSENSCYVTLEFIIDDNNYIVTRYKEPKTDLHIEFNGKDISGKGIRESETILNEYLPDLTSNLIASIIILGQGLPNKFTSNSPSGRKEVLEKLSKSDFMIEDIKNRLGNRTQELLSQKRKYEDEILKGNSQKSVYVQQKEKLTTDINELEKPHDYEQTITKLNNDIDKLNESILKNTELINIASKCNSDLNQKYTNKLNDKNQDILKENEQFNSFKEQYLIKKNEYNSNIKILSTKITQLKNIKDICPTCGQKIPNVIKPDTTEDEKNLNKLNEELNLIESKYNAYLKEHTSMLSEIEKSYEEEISSISFEIKQLKDKVDLFENDNKIKNNSLITFKTNLQKTILEKENYENKLKECKDTLYNLDLLLKKLDEEILYNINIKEDTEKHLNIVNQLNTLVKRDFRGFLLTNVINYINSKAKEYTKDIFDTDQLEFSLDGNNIDITYCNKYFENLSGGEKQKIDLIVQFAIRDMMKQYLGFSSNILVLDEIFDALDSIGCSNILNLISNKLNDIESIFIISHRADELEIPYDSQLIITKNREGVSSIKWQ